MNNQLLAQDKLAAAAAAAAAALFTWMPAAQAAVVAVTPAAPIVVPYDYEGVYLKVHTGEIGYTWDALDGWDVNLFGVFEFGGLNFYTNGGNSAYSGIGSAAFPQAVGSIIGPGSDFGLRDLIIGYYFLDGGLNHLGFRFLNESTGVVNYGYALLSTTAGDGFPAAIVSYAYENTGAAITVTAVPEPASFALMGLGAAAVAVCGRRRRR